MEVKKLTEEQFDFFKQMSTIINDGKDMWYFLPYGFRQIDGNKFEVVLFKDVSKKVIEIIGELRND